MTFDEMTVDLLLAGDSAGLTKLAAKANAVVEGRVECPECGDTGPHDDNGAVGHERGFCCSGCGCYFDAEDV